MYGELDFKHTWKAGYITERSGNTHIGGHEREDRAFISWGEALQNEGSRHMQNSDIELLANLHIPEIIQEGEKSVKIYVTRGSL